MNIPWLEFGFFFHFFLRVALVGIKEIPPSRFHETLRILYEMSRELGVKAVLLSGGDNEKAHLFDGFENIFPVEIHFGFVIFHFN